MGHNTKAGSWLYKLLRRDLRALLHLLQVKGIPTHPITTKKPHTDQAPQRKARDTTNMMTEPVDVLL